MEFDEYRRLQVASVTGFSGTSEWEVLLTTSWPLFALLLWHSKFEGVCDSLPSTASRWLVEFGLFLAPQIVLFLYPQWAPAMVSLALLYALMAFTRRPSRSKAKASPLQTQRLPAITNARAAIMSMCTLGILAVDFRAFPRRFVKTETFGTSLMDVGVGTVVVSMGMMAARLWLNPKVRPITLVGRLFQAMKSTLPLLVLGALRMLLVKGVNYQEHISEYGVHWNFFITLGTLPVLVTLFFECFSLRSSFYAGLGISALYQAILSKGGLQTYLFSPDRAGLVAMNKEGIFSLAGYLGLTLMSLAVGVEMFSSAPQRTRRFYRRILILVAILSLLYFGCKRYLYILPSRRLANLPFVAVSLLFSLIQLLGFEAIEHVVGTGRVPMILEGISQNQLSFFLLGNLMTGGINVACQTLLQPTRVALGILLVYMAVLSALTTALHRYDVRLRL